MCCLRFRLSGPNTGLDWAREGRRKIPIFPRGIAQTAYTAIADKAAIQASEENSLIAQRVTDQKNVSFGEDALENSEENMQSSESCNIKSNVNYPPIVMTDQSLKVIIIDHINDGEFCRFLTVLFLGFERRRSP